MYKDALLLCNSVKCLVVHRVDSQDQRREIRTVCGLLLEADFGQR